jgi:two-component system NtrC family sensor kinase
VILGNLDVLSAELGDAAEPVRAEIELIIAQVYRVKDIIDSLLQYARPADYAGWIETLDVNELVQDTLKLVAHLLRRSGTGVELDLAATHPIRIARQDLQQVLVNLLVNAIHAQEQGASKLDPSGEPDGEPAYEPASEPVSNPVNDQANGQYTLRPIRVSTADWEHKGARIQVSDNGPGIEPELIDDVFTPFFSTKTVGTGSGLGLFVSHVLVRRYGGNITVRSAPGGGAEFNLWLLAEPRFDEDDRLRAEQLKETMQEDGVRPPKRKGDVCDEPLL